LFDGAIVGHPAPWVKGASCLLEVALHFAVAHGQLQPSERAGFQLADPLAGDARVLADVLEHPGFPGIQAKPCRHDVSFRLRQHVKHRVEIARHLNRSVGRIGMVLVLDEVGEAPVFLAADRGIERDDVPDDPTYFLQTGERHLLDLGHALVGRRRAVLLRLALVDGPQAVHGPDHVHRHADHAALVGQRAADGPPDPPHGGGRKLVAAPMVELPDRPDQAFAGPIAGRSLLGHQSDQVPLVVRLERGVCPIARR